MIHITFSLACVAVCSVWPCVISEAAGGNGQAVLVRADVDYEPGEHPHFITAHKLLGRTGLTQGHTAGGVGGTAAGTENGGNGRQAPGSGTAGGDWRKKLKLGEAVIGLEEGNTLQQVCLHKHTHE